MEDYKQKYEEALERAKCYKGLIAEMEIIFPELKEGEDEWIRKSIIGFLKTLASLKDGKTVSNENFNSETLLEWATWLEKQGEKKQHLELKDGYDTKFKVGDWVVLEDSLSTYKIVEVCKSWYEVISNNNGMQYSIGFDEEDDCRLWSIDDAKDGDVLSTKKGNPFIYDKNRYNNGLAYYYAGIDANEELTLKSPHHMLSHFGELRSVFPATKEQRDLLFQKMKEARYKWDSEKKELKKIEEKPEIKDDVLSRFAFYQYDDDAIYLSSLFVRESDRGHGYGSKVLKAAEEVAKTFGISKIRLKVERNTWMEKWYKKNGYEYLSSEGKYDWLENRVIDIKPDKIEQSPVWSEEDEKFFKTALWHISYSVSNGKRTDKHCDTTDWLKGVKERLKFLKERIQPQPKQEWSEEDDLNLNQAIHVCHQYGYFGVEFWLKCFRERMKNKQ